MLINLDFKPQVDLTLGTALLIVRFPMKVDRVYLRTLYGERQKIVIFPNGSDEREICLDRPNGVAPGLSQLCAEGSRIINYPAFFHKGVVSFRAPYEIAGENHGMWVSLWEDMIEDPRQLTLSWPTDETRYSLI